jgi:diguanylate cyclase (GGDEF)-like protein
MTTDKRASLLVVDDTHSNVDVLLELLDDEYTVSVALNGEDALALARDEPPDLVLLDIVMPGMDGFDVCRALKADAVTRDVPVIFITGITEESSIETAFDIGGVDYVTKPFKPRELLARVRTHVQLRRLVRHLDYISSHDKMTGLYNRARFFDLSQQAWLNDRPRLYAGMLDIDHFKHVNDTYGHPVGDRVIKGVASAMSEELGERAILGRIGGEEFAIIWTADDQEQVLRDVEDIRRKVAHLVWPQESGETVACTVSVGVADVTPNIGTLDELLKAADDALYEAKGTGRNRSVFRGRTLFQPD